MEPMDYGAGEIGLLEGDTLIIYTDGIVEAANTTGEEIVEWSKEQMAAYKHPRSVEIAEELPKSASGKILWRELQERYAASR